jgi:putative NADPH-quinone reductase
MSRRIAIIEGHPDSTSPHLCHDLATAYARGAEQAGHEISRIRIADLAFPWLKTKEEFESGSTPPGLASSLAMIARADHLMLVYPLWLGSMPAVMKAFLEQVFRPGFAFALASPGKKVSKLLKGKSAHIVVTMGMPAFVYRWYFGAHSLKCLKRSILGLCGIGPISESLLGSVESTSVATRQGWLAEMEARGRRGA